MKLVLEIDIFIGGNKNFKEKEKHFHNAIEKLSKEGKYKNHKFVFHPGIGREDSPPPQDQENFNKIVEDVDLLFLFFEEGIGTINKTVTKSDEVINYLCQQYDLTSDEAKCNSVLEFGHAEFRNPKCKIHFIINTKVENPGEFTKLQTFLNKIQLKGANVQKGNFKGFYTQESLSGIENYIFNKIKDFIDKRVDDYNRAQATRPIEYPTRAGICAYEIMYEMLDSCKNVFSFNVLNSTATQDEEETPRGQFGKKLQSLIINKKINFTRVSAFTDIQKLNDTFDDIEVLYNVPRINISYYPYLHISPKPINNINTDNNRNFHDHANIVLFSPKGTFIEGAGMWGLFRDKKVDGKYLSAGLLYNNLSQDHPLYRYAMRLKIDFELSAPLFISHQSDYRIYEEIETCYNIEDFNADKFKTEIEGFHPKNFFILIKLLTRNFPYQYKPLQTKLCNLCRKISRGNVFSVKNKETDEPSLLFKEIMSTFNINPKDINCNTEKCSKK